MQRQGHVSIDDFIDAASVSGEENLEIMQRYLDQRPDDPNAINAIDKSGDTALICAASIGAAGNVDFLIKHGADIHFKNDRALVCAAAHHNSDWSSDKHVRNLRALLDAGANVNANGDYHDYCTPLTCAVMHDSSEAVEMLLEHPKMNLDFNDQGKKALELAKKYYKNHQYSSSLASLLERHIAKAQRDKETHQSLAAESQMQMFGLFAFFSLQQRHVSTDTSQPNTERRP